MLVLEENCTCADDQCCPACEEWRQRHSELMDVLRLKPWEFPAYEETPEYEGRHKPDVDAAVARFHVLKAAADKA